MGCFGKPWQTNCSFGGGRRLFCTQRLRAHGGFSVQVVTLSPKPKNPKTLERLRAPGSRTIDSGNLNRALVLGKSAIAEGWWGLYVGDGSEFGVSGGYEISLWLKLQVCVWLQTKG